MKLLVSPRSALHFPRCPNFSNENQMKTICTYADEQTTRLRKKIGLTVLFGFVLALVATLTSNASGQQIDGQIELISDESVPSEPVVVEGVRLMLVHNVPVAAREAGIVTALPLTEGDEVRTQQVVVQLDQNIYEAQLESAVQQSLIAKKESTNDIDVRYAKKSASVNQKVLARSAQAARQYNKSVSRTELERLQLELERSKLSTEQAAHSQEVKQLTCELRNAECQLAEIRLDERAIKSPVDGQIAELLVQVGQHVASGQSVARVISLDKLKIEAYVASDEVNDISKGQSASIEATLNNQTLRSSGTVRFVSPEIDPLNGDVRVIIEVDNQERKLKPGMMVELTIGD